MVNESLETSMVNDLACNYSLIHSNPKDTSGNPDVSFVYKNTLYILEAKHESSGYSGNVANYAKQMMTEIAMNNKSYNEGMMDFKNRKSLPKKVAYGLLLPYDNCELSRIYNFCKKHYSNFYWNSFYFLCKARAVFLYDQVNHVLYKADWFNFLKKPKIVEV